MATYKTPGVFVEEISTLPPSIAEVETAIPAFIGYTEKGTINVPKKISSLLEYQLNFGSAEPEKSIAVAIQGDTILVSSDPKKRSKNILFYAMQLYFANGGGPCYVVSTGGFDASANAKNDVYKAALDAVGKEDEPTLLVFPDAPYLIPATYYNLIIDALNQCVLLGDRFVKGAFDLANGVDVRLLFDGLLGSRASLRASPRRERENEDGCENEDR